MDVKNSTGMKCPRCDGPVAVGQNLATMHFGLIGAIIGLLMTSYECPKCGPIPFGELPPEVRNKSRWEAILGVLLMLAILAGLIVLLVWLNSLE